MYLAKELTWRKCCRTLRTYSMMAEVIMLPWIQPRDFQASTLFYQTLLLSGRSQPPEEPVPESPAAADILCQWF